MQRKGAMGWKVCPKAETGGRAIPVCTGVSYPIATTEIQTPREKILENSPIEIIKELLHYYVE